MHNKFVSPAGWSFHQPIVSQVKLGSDGRFCGGNDRSLFLKRASNLFLPLLDQIKIASDEVPLHVIALGATEKWGANRNGDGFLCHTCRNNYDSFKTARWYYNHVHHDPKNSYGVVKCAVWNEDMARIELLVALNASKSAAERNEGKIADKTLRLLGENKPVATSMGCRINYDVCSACGNKARTRKYYCDESKCAGGGCKHNLGKLVKLAGDTHHLHVENPHPVWYDISDVSDTRPADKTAYGTMADWMCKAASAEGFAAGYSGSQSAELLGAAATIWDELHPLATEMEKIGVAIGRAQHQGFDDNVLGALTSRFSVETVMQKLSSSVPGNATILDIVSAMAKQGAILPLSAFGQLTGKSPSIVKEAANYLPKAQEKVAMEIEDLIPKTGGWVCREPVSVKLTPSASDFVDRAYGLTKTGVQLRSLSSSAPRKVAAVADTHVSEVARELAEQYAVYKTSAVALAPRVDFALTARLAAGQNLVL
jgi:hypothetical protein